MRVDVITLFPEMIRVLSVGGVVGRAIEKQILHIECWNPRDYADDRHRTVDDRPYGGGPGMVMMVEPLKAAIRAAKGVGQDCSVVHMSPQGRPLTQAALKAFAQRARVILVASRYEGVDQRLIDAEIDEEWSIGDYVLSGGELPSMVLIDGAMRLVPGVLGAEDSAAQDSFSDGFLDFPHYTRPAEVEGQTVPPVLLSGDHAAIGRWRLKQGLGQTWLRRPDLLENRQLTADQQECLQEFIDEYELDKKSVILTGLGHMEGSQ